jgi:hypothetical protein
MRVTKKSVPNWCLSPPDFSCFTGMFHGMSMCQSEIKQPFSMFEVGFVRLYCQEREGENDEKLLDVQLGKN